MKSVLKVALAAGCLAMAAVSHAAEPFKIGLIVPLSGPFAPFGKQIETGVRLYMHQHGDTVAGRKVELIVKDDGGIQPELTNRLAQELVVKEGVDALAGFGLTPLAFATAPIATKAKIPMIVMSASTSSVVDKSPFIVRTSMTEAQVTAPIADWAAKDPKANLKTVVTLVSDYGPGLDSEKIFVKRYTEGGGKVLDTMRVPLVNPDFSPFLQRVMDLKPDGLFVFVPPGPGVTLIKQFKERGLKDAGIQLMSTGGLLDDDLLPNIGDDALGTITSGHYSAAHDSPENKAYVEQYRAFVKNSMRPNFMSIGGYDGIHVIYAALEKAGPDATGEQLVEAMKGMEWVSPRGPVRIDPESRDIVQNVYLRRTEKVGDELYNVEFETVEEVEDPGV